jgi:hypothetical protein
MRANRFDDDCNDIGEGMLFSLIESESPARIFEHPTSVTDLAARFERLASDRGDVENMDLRCTGSVVVARRHHDGIGNGDRCYGNDAILNDERPVIANNLMKLRAGVNIRRHDDDDDSIYSTEESDIDEFLDYARDVIAQNNTSYDPGSFRDFELLMQDSISKHFLDDDQDADSLVSLSSFSGYADEEGNRKKASLLNNPIISDTTLHRIQGFIARKKTSSGVESFADAGTSDLNHNSALMSSSRTYVTADDSDECEIPFSTLVLRRFEESRKSTSQRSLPNFPGRHEINPCDMSTLISDTSSMIESPPPRPKRRKRKPGKSKRSRSSVPFHPACQESNASRPPLSRTGTNIRRHSGPLSSWNSENLKSTESEKRISSLMRNPENRDKVLQFLRQRAPNLYDSVLTRLQLESSIEESPFKSFSDNDSVDLRTPEKQSRGRDQISFSDYEMNLPSEPCWYVNVDNTSVILPSTARGVTFSAVGVSASILQRLNMDDTIDLVPTAGIDRVLSDKQRKATIMKEKEYMFKEIQERLMIQQESITQRGMALIHKLRAKRKVALQAKYLKQSEQYQIPSEIFPSSLGTSESNRFRGVELSPEQLERYLSTGNQGSLPTTPSTLEEKKDRLRKLKERRRRASFSREDSEKTLLRYESNDEMVLKSRRDSLEGASKSAASPFTTVSVPRAKVERTYEVLSESFPHPAVVFDKSTTPKPSSSVSSTNRRRKRFFNNHLRADGIDSILSQESTDCVVSPIREGQLTDSSDNSNFVPTIFEDAISYDDNECLIQPSLEAGIWSDMSFHSDTDRFVESPAGAAATTNTTSRDISKFGGDSTFSSTAPSTNVISTTPLHQQDTDNTTPNKGYNDSFDEIIYRQTPSQKVSVTPGEDQSPTGVADFSLSTRSFQLHRSSSLAFVDDEENDPLFTDKEDSFDILSIPGGSTIQKPVFLSPSLFEI